MKGEVLADLHALQQVLRGESEQGRRIALVPTMGALHQGHLELVRRASALADVVVVSIYINPMQFAEGEDLDEYPRTRQDDLLMLEREPCDWVFTPDDALMYPHEPRTQLQVPLLALRFCGADRPAFFPGICQVVARLLNMVQPQVVVFGEKDLQQLRVIQCLVEDLAFPVEVAGVATVREDDGLAMSSRNQYLSASEREKAPLLYAALCDIRHRVERGEDLDAALATAKEHLKGEGFAISYLDSARLSDLQPPTAEDRHLAVLAAAQLGKTRLIDNIRIDRLASEAS